MFSPGDLRRGTECVQHPAAMFRFGLFQSDCERGFYHVQAITQSPQCLHRNPPRNRLLGDFAQLPIVPLARTSVYEVGQKQSFRSVYRRRQRRFKPRS